MSHRDDVKKLITEYSRRLQKLKEKQAAYGMSVDPQVLLEIEDIEAKIEALQTELDNCPRHPLNRPAQYR